MTSSLWNLRADRATLDIASLAATLDLTHPANGLGITRALGASVADAQFLGISIPGLSESGQHSITDRYVRQEDLTAAYELTGDCPLHVDARWSVCDGTSNDSRFVAVEVLVSVRTWVLDSLSQLSVVSRCPAEEVLHSIGGEIDVFATIAPAAADHLEFSEAPAGRGCMLLRLPESVISYVEMVRPGDFQSEEIAFQASVPQRAGILHRLSVEHLEKGVILRARVRGVFVPRDNDEQIAAEQYQAFVESPLPLAT